MHDLSKLCSEPVRAAGQIGFGRPGVATPTGMLELLHLMDANADEACSMMEIPVPVRLLHAGDTLFREGAPAEAIYFVRAGTFKAFSTLNDGYEQVLGFSGRAEVLGFDAICTGRHPNEVVALEPSSVFVVLVRDFLSLGQHMPALGRAVLLAASRALTLQGQLADVMAAVAAEVRLARFLEQLSQRMASCGQSPRRFHLRMSRRDIASYLGVAHETVSRSFGALAGNGLISVDNREVEILDMAGLKACSAGTRRQVDECGRPQPTCARAVRPASGQLAA